MLAAMDSGPQESTAPRPWRVRPVRALIGAAMRASPELKPAIEKFVWRAVYEAGALILGGYAQLNYGYAELSESPATANQDGYGLALYENGRWNRVEHYHFECYDDAGQPYGEPL